ncbi:protein cueball isoform X2 [Anoplolepis gracilipes]
MYLSDVRNNVSIFSNVLTEKDFNSTPLLKKENGMHIMGVVFDTLSHTLFWSDALKEIIATMYVPLDGKPSNPVILHNLTGNSPRGIALDACSRHIYWVNSNTTNPSIERSKLDGSDRKIVIKENLYEPLAVAVDHAERKLYWIDDVEGIHFKIERSNLDGSERELLVHNKHQQPVYLAVDSESFYWSDWVYSAVWTMPKNAKAGDLPTKFKSYYDSRRDADPAGIVTRDNTGKIDCLSILSIINKRTNVSRLVSRAETFNNLTTSTEESDLTTESSKYCLNGKLNKTDDMCRCKPGFTGPFCEISICHNYCLHGKCIINHHGLPECECSGTFSGVRCEKDVCHDYCLFDGKCSVQNGRPFCNCKYSSMGSRCEEPNNITEICPIYCANNRSELSSISIMLCRCTNSNQTAERITFNDNFQSGILLPMFAALIAALLVMIAGLSFYVNKLRRRPRIKRHYVVSKGVMPLTSRPEIPDNQCEITIENCCNMNICETPCFEPKLRTGVPRSNSIKKEEKNSLLDNMEGNSC